MLEIEEEKTKQAVPNSLEILFFPSFKNNKFQNFCYITGFKKGFVRCLIVVRKVSKRYGV